MININNQLWYIELVSPFDYHLERSDGSVTLGCCDRTNNTIYIANNLNEEYIKKVVCHEAVHAVMFSYGITLNLQEEEMFADLIATYGEEILKLTHIIIEQIKRELI